MAAESVYTPEQELDAHLAMLQWFESQRIAGKELFTHKELMDGFHWQGHRLRLTHQSMGIWKPGPFEAALTFKTAAPVAGRAAPYEDHIGDDGLLRYAFSSSKDWSNAAMIAAARRRLPLAWLVGTKPGNTLYYYVRFPAFIQTVDPGRRMFTISIGDAPMDPGQASAEIRVLERKYTSRWTRARLHQHDFREQVLGAYEVTCAVCGLPHAQLMEAAHIIPDADEAGVPEISNGIALCRTHHAAYDRHLLGIDPSLTVHVASRALRLEASRRQECLASHDGRALLMVPARKALRPSPDRLSAHFTRFVELEEELSV